jgi:hypothetical protein
LAGRNLSAPATAASQGRQKLLKRFKTGLVRMTPRLEGLTPHTRIVFHYVVRHGLPLHLRIEEAHDGMCTLRDGDARDALLLGFFVP